MFDFLETAIYGTLTFGSIVRVIIIFLVCLIAIRILSVVASKMLKRTKLNAVLQSFAITAIKIVLWILTVIIIADSLGISTTSLVAIVSVAGLALSLSIQSVLSNLFSGITLLFTRPFDAGHYVDIGGKSGTITKIGLFYTVMETPDKVVISIPNGDVSSSAIQNYSANEKRRVDMAFRGSYDCPVERVKDAIIQAALRDGRIFSDPEPFVAVKEYGESSVTYMLRVWCSSADYWNVYYALNENVRESFAKNNVTMTYNHLNVHIIP